MKQYLDKCAKMWATKAFSVIVFEIDVNYKQPKCSSTENMLNKRWSSQTVENRPGYRARRGSDCARTERHHGMICGAGERMQVPEQYTQSNPVYIFYRCTRALIALSHARTYTHMLTTKL